MIHQRVVCIDNGVATVTLNRGFVTTIDECNIPILGDYNWIVCPGKKTNYAMRTIPDGAGSVHAILLHREIIGAQNGQFVDHIDCNGLNNCRDNLRIASRSQNARNQRIRADNASGFKGVSFQINRGKWQAKITVDKRQIWLGLHDTPEQASMAYAEASAKYHGEFGRIS